jgi:elongation factor P
MKGGSVTARTKPATLATGLVVQVPEHLTTGDMIRVDTRTGEYASKA